MRNFNSEIECIALVKNFSLQFLSRALVGNFSGEL